MLCSRCLEGCHSTASIAIIHVATLPSYIELHEVLVITYLQVTGSGLRISWDKGEQRSSDDHLPTRYCALAHHLNKSITQIEHWHISVCTMLHEEGHSAVTKPPLCGRWTARMRQLYLSRGLAAA